MACRTTTPSASASPAARRARTPCSRSRRITAPRGRRPRPASLAWPTGPTCSGPPSPMRRGVHLDDGDTDGHHRHHRPTAGTLSLTGFTDTGSSVLRWPVERQHLRSERLGRGAGASVCFEFSTDMGRYMDNDHRQPVRPGGRDLPVPGDRDRCGGNVSTTATQTVTIDTNAPLRDAVADGASLTPGLRTRWPHERQ